MKRNIILVGSLAFAALWARATPKQDTLNKVIRKSEIELVYNHYLQDGNNSAVTGGKGTEKLTVYGPMLRMQHEKGRRQYNLILGTDLITSASTDRIDAVRSSASKHDARTYANGSFRKAVGPNGYSAMGGASISIESDYFSLGGKVELARANPSTLSSYYINFEFLRDDLRWGRLNPDHFKPVRLVYPAELRNKEWFTAYLRHTLNIRSGRSWIVNKRNRAGIFPNLTFQQGLLSTPFHRVYFTDGSKAVERLPSHRYKAGLTLRLHQFVGGKVVLKHSANGYHDSFGINAMAFEHETALMINPMLTIMANVRLFIQNGSRYYAAYGEHLRQNQYFSSDADLSTLRSHAVGVGLRYNPYSQPRQPLGSILLRYRHMSRNNGLSTHSISAALLLSATKSE